MLTEAVQSTNIKVVMQKKELMSTVIEVDKLCKTYGDIKADNGRRFTHALTPYQCSRIGWLVRSLFDSSCALLQVGIVITAHFL